MQDHPPDRIWPRLFALLMGLYTVTMLVTWSQYGITTDEPLHVAYGQHIAQWYTSFFRDQTVFTTSNLYLYGGLFDTLTHLLHQIIPIDIYNLRHILCAAVGLLGVWGSYKIGTKLGGPQMGLLAAFFLILTPHYYGHAFNNSKDIPFAVAYLWALYYLILCVNTLPHLPGQLIVKTGVAIGCALGIRASAALLVAYMGLFFGLRYLQLYLKGDTRFLQTWPSQVLHIILIGMVAYITLFPFYPWMHLHPVTGFWDSLTAFASFPEVHFNFFEGHYIPSNEIPWYYAPKWLLLTLPEFAIPALFVGLIFLLLKNSNHEWHTPQALQKTLVVFAAFFPLAYAAFTQTPLLNGIRHMTFVVPPLIVLCAMSTLWAIQHLSHPRIRQIVLATILGAAILTLSDMIALHPNQYLYFNRLFAGGISEAAKNYETDYWNNSYQQGIAWIENDLPIPSGRKLVIGSLYKNVPDMLDTDRFAFTQIPEEADVYLGNTWFDHHRAIAGEVLHIVKTMDTPLLYIIRPDSSYQNDPFFTQSPYFYDQLGDYRRSQGNLVAALQAYEKALPNFASGFKATWLDSTSVMHKMGNVLLGLNQPEAALRIFDHMPKREAFAGSIAHNFGIYYIDKQDATQALYWLQKAVDIAPNFYEATVSLGTLYLQMSDTAQAANMYQSTAERHVQNADRQFKMGNQLYGLNRFEAASNCFNRMIDLHEGDIRGHYYLGLTRAAMNDYPGARKALENAITIDTTQSNIYQSLATVCMYLEDYQAAIDAYQKAIVLTPDYAHLHTALGIAYLNRQNYDAAQKAFDKALAIDPGDPDAQKHQQLLKFNFKK